MVDKKKEEKKVEDKKEEPIKDIKADITPGNIEDGVEVEEPKVETPKVEKKVEKSTLVLKNVLGKEVKKEDYFYKGTVPAGFEGTCGKPVDREDLITVFHKVFKPKDNILFYKQSDKEVYIVIIPIKYATEIGDFNDSIESDFQKHAISFLNEGSVNIDTMKQKLERINKFVNYSDR